MPYKHLSGADGSDITVVVPAYNAAAALPRMLDSLLRQTHRAWTCIVVDGSRNDDSTARVVSDYAEKHPGKFRLIRTNRRGPYIARCIGLEAASTPWVMMADADDEMPPEAMQSLLALATDDVDMVVGAVHLVHPDGEATNLAISELDGVMSGTDFTSSVLDLEWLWATYGRLIRTSAIDRRRLAESAHMHGILEDAQMMMLMGLGMRRVRLAPHVPAYRYIRTGLGLGSSFVPTAAEFCDFCREIVAQCGLTPDLSLQLSRLAYSILMCRGVHLPLPCRRYLRSLWRTAARAEGLTRHDRLIRIILEYNTLRKRLARSHIAPESLLRPMFSVVVSAYNVERTIKRTIDSITRANTFNRLEIIVVNDASTDRTAQIVGRMAKADPRIRLVEHSANRGLNATRFTGLDHARGEWVLFADAGDRMAPHLIDRLHTHVHGPGKDSQIVLFGILQRTEHLPIEFAFWEAPEAGATLTSDEIFPHVLRRHGWPPSLWNKAYRRDFLRRLALHPEPDFYGEDYLTSIKIFAHDAHVTSLGQKGYVWYRGGGSHMPLRKQWQAELHLISQTANLLKTIDKYTDADLSLLGESLYESMLDILSRAYAKANHQSMTKLAKEMLHDIQTLDLPGISSPSHEGSIPQNGLTIQSLHTPDDLCAAAKTYYQTHRKSFLFRRLLD